MVNVSLQQDMVNPHAANNVAVLNGLVRYPLIGDREQMLIKRRVVAGDDRAVAKCVLCLLPIVFD
jgi:hypothetical protein